MNLNFKTICSAAVLCFVGNVFAMDSNSLKENSSNSKGFSQFIPIRQANSSTDINLVDIMKEMAKLRQQNKNLQKKNAGLQQQVEMYESVLDDVLDQTVHTRNKKVLENEYKKLIAAVKKKDIKTLESLIGQGVDIDETVFGNFSTPLKEAMERGYTDVITFLLNNGADPNKTPKVLEFTVNTGNKDLVELALLKGANPNKALELAVNSGNKDLVELALLKGADPNVLDKENNSMLMLALEHEYIEIAKLFLSNSCSGHILDFIYAGKNKQPMSNDSIKLKERLAIFKNYDTPNEKGGSPLIRAIRNLKHSDLLGILTSLLEHKLKLNRIDSSIGYSVLTLAKLKKRGEEIIELLEDAGARDGDMLNGEDPVYRLLKYCEDKSNNLSWSNLKFEFDMDSERKFRCVITIDRGNGNDEDVYDNGKSYNTKTEAKKKIAEHVYNLLVAKAKNGEASSSGTN